MACNAPKFCCNSGVQGDQKCLGKCIDVYDLNDRRKDCDNGSDEGVTGKYCIDKKKDTFYLFIHAFSFQWHVMHQTFAVRVGFRGIKNAGENV